MCLLKKETENQSKQQPVAAATQVKVEDENMKKSKKIKLSPIKGQARQIKVESPGSKSDSESKDQPKEMTTVKHDAHETHIGTPGDSTFICLAWPLIGLSLISFDFFMFSSSTLTCVAAATGCCLL
jgi:hypothetical protein